jgi:hypothetical protein
MLCKHNASAVPVAKRYGLFSVGDLDNSKRR